MRSTKGIKILRCHDSFLIQSLVRGLSFFDFIRNFVFILAFSLSMEKPQLASKLGKEFLQK